MEERNLDSSSRSLVSSLAVIILSHEISCLSVLSLHPSTRRGGINRTAEAPGQFINWFQNVLNDWPFDNIVVAHMGNKIGGAKAAMEELLKRETPKLLKYAEEVQIIFIFLLIDFRTKRMKERFSRRSPLRKMKIVPTFKAMSVDKIPLFLSRCNKRKSSDVSWEIEFWL